MTSLSLTIRAISRANQPKQTAFVEQFVDGFSEIELDAELVYQDESLSSVEAERRLGRVKDKGEIDAEAASIILQDYLEVHYADS